MLLAEDSFSSEQVACKIIDHKGQGLVEHSRASRKESALREVDILKQLSHVSKLDWRTQAPGTKRLSAKHPQPQERISHQ